MWHLVITLGLTRYLKVYFDSYILFCYDLL